MEVKEGISDEVIAEAFKELIEEGNIECWGNTICIPYQYVYTPTGGVGKQLLFEPFKPSTWRKKYYYVDPMYCYNPQFIVKQKRTGKTVKVLKNGLYGVNVVFDVKHIPDSNEFKKNRVYKVEVKEGKVNVVGPGDIRGLKDSFKSYTMSKHVNRKTSIAWSQIPLYAVIPIAVFYKDSVRKGILNCYLDLVIPQNFSPFLWAKQLVNAGVGSFITVLGRKRLAVMRCPIWDWRLCELISDCILLQYYSTSNTDFLVKYRVCSKPGGGKVNVMLNFVFLLNNDILLKRLYRKWRRLYRAHRIPKYEELLVPVIDAKTIVLLDASMRDKLEYYIEHLSDIRGVEELNFIASVSKEYNERLYSGYSSSASSS